MGIVEFQETLAEIEREMDLAEESRRQGREGRARVCARRAAGMAVAVFQERKTGVRPQANFYRLLRWFQQADDVPDRLKQAAARLTTRVRSDYSLPHPDDPLQDARTLIEALLSEDEDKH
ncbi:MAG: hypothetical protein P8Z42_04630 [Anaerolineales bacterium]|jgi:HEPN domain-containing protein